jgi:hypothetical protein
MNDYGGLVRNLKNVRGYSSLIGIGVMVFISCAAQAEGATDTTWPDLSGDWAVVQKLVATADLTIVGSIWIDTVVGALTHITQSGSSLVLQDAYCFTDASPSSFLFSTNIADIVMESINPEPRTGSLSLVDCDFRFSQDWYTEVRGAVLEDRENDSLPVDPNDPRLVDLEGDGNPGMTIEASILGMFRGEGYAVQRYRYRLEGSVLDANTIAGFIEWTSDQVVVAATNPLFMEAFEDDTDPDPTKHRFVMIRIDETWNCQTLREQLPALMELLDF